MGMTIGQKLIKSHLVSGDMTVGSEVGLRIDQTLTQDATGTMAYLELEAMGIDQVKTELSVQDIAAQVGYDNPLNFSKAFKGNCGLSPLHFRQSEKKERKNE